MPNRSYRKNHYIRETGTTVNRAAAVNLSQVVIPTGAGLVIKNCQFQGKARGLPVAAQAWVHSYITQAVWVYEGGALILGSLATTTRYFGSGVSLTNAEGTLNTAANAILFQVQGVPDGPSYTNQIIDWWVEYEISWGYDDFPE